ncbi:hypothetical protein Hamer_G031005 [Homarus americanus]|uniref:Uncharacterized protein n=1 Tax=Homarus americanus TaxID=6706 RepID=A0A8J5NAT7_HOMAM|nr:hypothetical protein Hamer_G031005 [Homarus americanus]
MTFLNKEYRPYVGSESFQFFAQDNLRFSDNINERVLRDELGETYIKFCTERNLPIASMVNIGAHLAQSGVCVKRLGTRFGQQYGYCHLQWIDPTGFTKYFPIYKKRKADKEVCPTLPKYKPPIEKPPPVNREPVKVIVLQCVKLRRF